MITIFFLTHIFDREINRRYKKLKNQLPDGHQLILLADSEYKSQFESVTGEDILYFDTKTIAKKSYASRLKESNANLTPGNIDQVLLWATTLFPNSTHFWLIEYDVVFTGNWKFFFKTFEDNNASLLGTSFQKKSKCTNWFWWRSFRKPEQDTTKPGVKTGDEPIRSFMPIMRISADAATFLRAHYSANSWKGHMEAVVPTALNESNYTIEDIGGDSHKTPKQRKNKMYSNTLGTNNLDPGTFRFRPAMRLPGRQPNMLYHPVKTVNRFQMAFYLIARIGNLFRLWRL